LTSLGSLYLELGLQTDNFDRSLASIKNQTAAMGKDLERSLKVAPTFDAKVLQNQIRQTESQKPTIAIGVKVDRLQVAHEISQTTSTTLDLRATLTINSSNVEQVRARLERSLQVTVSADTPSNTSRKVELDTKGLEEDLTKAVTEGTKKAQARSGLFAPITGGLQNTIRGFQEGVGATYARKFTEGSIKNIEAELGTSLDKLGEKFSAGFGKAGKFAGDRFVKRLGIEEGLAGLKPKVAQATEFLNEIIDTKTLDRKFSVLETQIGKLIDDLLRLKGVGVQVGNLQGIAGAVADIAATPLEGIEDRRQRLVKEAAKTAQARSEQIEAPKYDNADSVVFGIGGFAGNEDKAQRGKSSIPVAERLQLLTGERNPVIPVENQATDLSVNLGEGKLRFFAEAINKIVMQNLVVSKDAIEAAAQAIAVRRENPDLPIGIAGYSAGGFTARESSEVLNAANVDNVRAVGIGTPRFSSTASTTKEQFQTVLGEGDPLSKIARLSGAKDAQIHAEGGKGHKLSSYLSADDTQGAILKQLNIKRQIPAELKSAVAFEMKSVEQDMEAAANDFMAAMQGSDFYLKTGLYKTVIAKIKINREKLQLLMEQATGNLDQTLAGYDEQLAEAETMLYQAFGTQQQAAPALKARQREQAIVEAAAIPPPQMAQPLQTKPLDRSIISGYNTEILKEVSSLSGGAGKGTKDRLVKELLEADARSVREAFDAIAPLVQTGPKGGQSIKKLPQSAEEKKAIAATKDAEKRINDSLRIFVDAQGKRREEIAAAANNEINATLAELEKLRASQSPDTRLQAGRTRGRLESLRTNFNAADVEGLARSPRETLRDATGALAKSFNAEPVGSIRGNLAQTARTPKAKAIATDLAVNTAGFAASQLGNNFGVVPGLAGDLVGALVARQAIAASAEVFKAYQSSTGRQFKEIARAALNGMRGAAFQKEMGANLTGDLTGFAIGNVSAMAANAGLSALNGVVPGAGLLGKIPLKGAAVAMATVPRIVNARERVLEPDVAELARVGDQPKQGLLGGLINRAKADTEKAKAAIASGLNKTMDALEERYIKEPTPVAQPPSMAAKVQAAAREAQKQVERLPQQLKLTTDQTYQLLVQEAAKLSKVTIKPGDLPKLVVDDAKLQAIGARALYNIKNNQIIITKEVAAMLSGTVDQIEKQQEAIKDVVHESRHAFQFDFGRSSIAKQSLGFAQPGVALAPIQELPRSMQYNAMRSAQVANQQAGGLLPQNFQRTIARTEADAYAFETQAPKVFSNVATRVRSGEALPQPIQEAQPNQRMVDFFVKALQAKQSVGNAIGNPLGAIGNAFGALKESALGGLGSQVSVARSPQATGSLKAEALENAVSYVESFKQGLQQLGIFIPKIVESAIDTIPGILSKLPGFADRAVKGILGNFGLIVKGVGAIGLTIAAVNIFKPIVDQSLVAARNLNNFKTALDFASGSAAQAGVDFKFVDKTVDDLGIPLESTRQGFKNLAASTKGTAAEGFAVKETITGVSQAATVLGLTSEQTAQVMKALSDMASKGSVQMEELKGQLGDAGLTGVMKTAADAMGITEKELAKLTESGQLSAEEFIPKFGRQLQIAYGASAKTASQNVQSSENRFNAANQRAQEAFGLVIQPAQKAGLDTATIAVDLLAGAMEKLGSIIAITAAYIGGNLIVRLTGMATAAITGSTAVASLGVIFNATTARMIEQSVMIAAKFLLFSAAIESVQSLMRQFTPDENTKQFNKFTDEAVSGLKRIEEAAKAARGEVAGIGNDKKDLPSQGFDLTLGLGGMFGKSFKTDDAIKIRNNLVEKMGLTGLGRMTTLAESKQFDQQVSLGDQALAAQDVAAKAFDASGMNAQIAKVKALDDQMKAIDMQRQKLQMQPNADKNQLEVLRQQRQALSEQRDKQASPILEQSAQIDSALKNFRESVKQAKELGLPTEEYEATIKLLEKAQSVQTQYNRKLSEAAVLAANFADKWNLATAKAQDAQKAIDASVSGSKSDVLKQQLTGGLNSEQAQQKTAQLDTQGVEQKLGASQDELAKKQQYLQSIDATSTLKAAGIDPNAGAAELKLKAGQASNPQLKKAIESTAEFKDLQDQLPAQQLQVDQSKLQQQQTERQLAANLRQRSDANDAAYATRVELTRNTQLRKDQSAINVKKSRNQYYSDADAGVAEADLGLSQAQSQQQSAGAGLANSGAALSRLREDYKAGKIDQIDFKNQERDLITQVAQARAKSAEAEAQIEEAKGKRIEAINRKRIEQIQKVTAAEASALSRRQALANADFATQRAKLTMQKAKNVFFSDAEAGVADADLGISQAKTQKDLAGQAIVNVEREMQRNKQLYQERRINAKKFHDDELALGDKLTEARARGTEAAASLEESYAKKIEATTRQKIEQINFLNQSAAAAIALAQTQQTTALQGNLLNSPDAGEFSQAQAGRSQTLIEQGTSVATLALNRKAIEDNKALVAEGSRSRKEGILEEQRLNKETADIQLAQAQRQVQMQQQLRDSRIKSLEAVAKLETDQLDRSKQLLESQGALAKAQSDLAIARDTTQLNKIDRLVGLQDRVESDPKMDPRLKALIGKQLNESGASGVNANSKSYEILLARQKIEDSIADKQRGAREKEAELSKKSLEFDIRKQEIAAKLLVIEGQRYKLDADRAKLQAVKDYSTAIKSGDKEGMAIAQMSLAIANNMSKVADIQIQTALEGLANQKEMAQNSRQVLALNQETAREQFEGQDQNRRANNDVSFIEQLIKSGMQGSIPGRAKGGDVQAGKPYVVGEKGQELFIPKVSGEIIDASKTATILSGQNMQGAKQAIQARATGGPVNAGQPYLVGERGAEAFAPSGSGSADGIGQLLAGLGALITLIGVTASGIKKPAQEMSNAAIDTAIRPTISGNGMADTAIRPTIAGNGQLDTAIRPAIAGNGIADTSFRPTVIGAGMNNAPPLGSSGLADKPIPSLGGGAVGGSGGGDVSSKLDQLINVISSAMGRPNLTVSSPSPVNDAAKIYSDISAQQVSNANI
jgi:tape measure domain-containing protein